MWKLSEALLISCKVGSPAALSLCNADGSPAQREHHQAWGTKSWSSAAKELSLTLLANSGIIKAMQRIHHHIGRQASKQA